MPPFETEKFYNGSLFFRTCDGKFVELPEIKELEVSSPSKCQEDVGEKIAIDFKNSIECNFTAFVQTKFHKKLRKMLRHDENVINRFIRRQKRLKEQERRSKLKLEALHT